MIRRKNVVLLKELRRTTFFIGKGGTLEIIRGIHKNRC